MRDPQAHGETTTVAESPPQRVLFLIAPTGTYCREDRCQSYFSFELIPSMRSPMEECEAAGSLRAEGVEPFLIDAPAASMTAEETEQRILATRPDLVVIVVTFGTLEADLAWAKRVRDLLPAAAIGVRGAPCYVQAEEILRTTPHVDFCVRGDYEVVFAEIARKGYRAAAGTVLREGDGIATSAPAPLAPDLDALPFPDRTVLDAKLYRVRGFGSPQATIHVQRGCPYPCTYCLVHTVSGANARHRSPRSIATEMAQVAATGGRFFYLRADTFSLDREWAIETSRAIEELCPKARWVTSTRTDCVDERVVEAMQRGGCYGISFGIDVGSETIAKHVRKKVDVDAAVRAMRLCDRFGVFSLGYFMIGFLWETEQSLAETAAMIRRARPDLLTIHFAHPYPGTVYAADVAQHNVSISSPRAQAEAAFDCEGLSADTLNKSARRMLARHYARPRVLTSVATKALRLGARTLRQR